jgi:hypothetical protein
MKHDYGGHQQKHRLPMRDSKANHFCQTLVRIIGADQQLKIIKQLNDEFVPLAHDIAVTLLI